MPRSKRPSFLTKQKEMARRARATEKREARRARRKARVNDAPIEEVAPAEEVQDPGERA
jgi:hypothetical protein